MCVCMCMCVCVRRVRGAQVFGHRMLPGRRRGRGGARRPGSMRWRRGGVGGQGGYPPAVLLPPLARRPALPSLRRLSLPRLPSLSLARLRPLATDLLRGGGVRCQAAHARRLEQRAVVEGVDHARDELRGETSRCTQSADARNQQMHAVSQQMHAGVHVHVQVHVVIVKWSYQVVIVSGHSQWP